MTDRLFALTVALERDIRDDDAAPLIEAIRMLRGVLSVEPHVADQRLYVAEERAKHELRGQLRSVLWPELHH